MEKNKYKNYWCPVNDSPIVWRLEHMNALFIGNSFTFYNDMPKIAENIAKNLGYDLTCDSVTVGGYTLEQYADPTDEYGKKVDEKLKSSTKYNYIILQEYSTRSYTHFDSFDKAVSTLKTNINEYQNTAEISLYETWGFEEEASANKRTIPQMEEEICSKYDSVANKYNLSVHYVGKAFSEVYENHPEINLYAEDKKHPSYEGSYLSALVHIGTMFNCDVRSTSFNGELDENVANTLKEVAFNVVFYGKVELKKEALKKHYEWKGKIEIKPRVDVFSKESLSMAYTPGVAEACMKIHENKDESFNLTRRWNVVPVITDGTAVLGLGDIGPEAGMPVMEGKCALFKAYGDVDAIPLCIRSKDSEEIIKTIELLAGSFGGINLEDIAAPRCFEIEKRLKEDLDIPVFHDDQHGTAIVTLAALINALKLAKKDIADVKIVINGAGAAGVAIAKLLLSYGAKHIICCDSKGIIKKGDPRLNESKKELAEVTNLELLEGKLEDAMKNSDVFIGVSVAHCVTKDMVRSMNKDPILFTCANPIPEILPEESYEAGAFIVGTGSSEYPNQINNVLVFPGLFRGAIDAKANTVNLEMMKAAALAIASCVKDDELNRNYILPFAWDKVAHLKVADEVKKAAIRTGAIRK